MSFFRFLPTQSVVTKTVFPSVLTCRFASLALVGVLACGTKLVQANTNFYTSPSVVSKRMQIYEPITITTADAIVPGQPLACDVELTGGPANITITSSPAGAVYYSGTVSGATATVQAATSSSVSGTVMIYLQTDGESVVYMSVRVAAGGGDGIAKRVVKK